MTGKAECNLSNIRRLGGRFMKLSARNILKGKVTMLKPGAINTEVILELQGGG